MPSSDKNSKIFVSNLSSRVQESDLRSHFETYGKIVDLDIVERREIHATIEFEDHKDAEEAAQKGNSSELLGRRLRVEMYKSKTFERSSRERGQECYNCNIKYNFKMLNSLCCTTNQMSYF